MASPQVLAARQKFLALVLAKMNEADPKASAWVARLEQLQGAAIPASDLESRILPARLASFDPHDPPHDRLMQPQIAARPPCHPCHRPCVKPRLPSEGVEAGVSRLNTAGEALVVDDGERLIVGRRLKDEFENGRSYYGLPGQPLSLPSDAHLRPDATALAWHREQVFRG